MKWYFAKIINMKTTNKIFALSTLFLLVQSIPFSVANRDTFVKGTRFEKLKNENIINLNPTKEEDIRSYYASLESLPADERKNQNLLKNLKPILRNDFKYYSYEEVWQIYEITDRDWTKSPAKDITYGQYDEKQNIFINYEYGTSKSNSKNNPYIHCYYRNQTITDENEYIKAWDDHNQTGINREHLWPQSYGFKASKGAKGPAGTDLHHLVAADGEVNQLVHNNVPYGNVDEVSKTGSRISTKNNKLGTPKSKSIKDEGNLVFEPQDSDKGDIARACFYMVAMYNNLANDNNITDFDANLELVDYVNEILDKGVISTAKETVKLGNLKDLLEWNRLDPVDEYEIHRNDLIYNNYQFNRNPFIDYPQWADIIWGNDGSSEKYAKPTTDEISKSSAPSGTYDDVNHDDITEDDNFFTKDKIIIGLIIIGAFLIVLIILIARSNRKKKLSTKEKKQIKTAINKVINTSGTKRKRSTNSSTKRNGTTKKATNKKRK